MALTKKSVELLAPAGTFETFKAAIEAGADAVYLGGKHFNMRVHKNDFNLSDDELKAAVTYAHQRGVKLDITLNNLISVEEIPPLEKYLHFLNEIQPDAVIVQDLAVVHLIKKLGLNIPIHASVMMNINSISAVEVLKNLGIKRVVVGRELNLNEVKYLREKTGIETICALRLRGNAYIRALHSDKAATGDVVSSRAVGRTNSLTKRRAKFWTTQATNWRWAICAFCAIFRS